MKLVTFHTWQNDIETKKPKSVTINPNEVSDIEDYCGDIRPGSVITLKNKKTYLVDGKHEWIVALIEAARKE